MDNKNYKELKILYKTNKCFFKELKYGDFFIYNREVFF